RAALHRASTLLHLNLSFFFYSYGAHRDLHSFPTRRSSDLAGASPIFLATHFGLPPAPQRASTAFIRRLINSMSGAGVAMPLVDLDRKSTRLNSSHVKISYAVFCLKKKKNIKKLIHILQYTD